MSETFSLFLKVIIWNRWWLNDKRAVEIVTYLISLIHQIVFSFFIWIYWFTNFNFLLFSLTIVIYIVFRLANDCASVRSLKAFFFFKDSLRTISSFKIPNSEVYAANNNNAQYNPNPWWLGIIFFTITTI